MTCLAANSRMENITRLITTKKLPESINENISKASNGCRPRSCWHITSKYKVLQIYHINWTLNHFNYTVCKTTFANAMQLINYISSEFVRNIPERPIYITIAILVVLIKMTEMSFRVSLIGKNKKRKTS